MPLLVPVGTLPPELVLSSNDDSPGSALSSFCVSLRNANVCGARMIAYWGGILMALYWSSNFSLGAWYTGITLLVFAFVGRIIALREVGEGNG